MERKITVSAIMAKKPMTLRPDDGLQTAVERMAKYGYHGLPVVEKSGKLVGILTEYDMVAHGSGLHLPTILNLMENIAVNRADKKFVEEYLDSVNRVKVRDAMNTDPLTVHEDTPVEEVAKEFAEHHKVNPILVLDKAGGLVGLVSRYDIIRFFNQEYLHQMIAGAPAHAESLEHLQRSQTEAKFERLVEELSGGYLLVNKRRPMMWKIMFVAAFFVGFFASIAWIVKITFR